MFRLILYRIKCEIISVKVIMGSRGITAVWNPSNLNTEVKFFSLDSARLVL